MKTPVSAAATVLAPGSSWMLRAGAGSVLRLLGITWVPGFMERDPEISPGSPPRAFRKREAVKQTGCRPNLQRTNETMHTP